MTVFKCKMCGGNLEVAEGSSVAMCEYCGVEQTIPTSSDEEIVNLFNRANYLRLKCEFDKAADTYERILELDNTQAEAHWGIVLCKYGVEYVEDKKALFDDERKPTCHRTQMESILSDADYQATLDNADSAAAEIYKLQAREINDLQKKILDVVKNEAPYDVFICYKERDANDQRTQDSVIANDIYHELTESGLKVFYAAITLEDKLGEEYEPYIYAALSSARVMIALGTKIEYFNAVWVKNEWSRYLHMMKMNKDKKRTLIPCYRDMDAYDLPAEFAHLQALNMADIAFLPDLIRNIKKLVGKDSKGSAMNSGGSVNPVEPLLRRAYLLLEDGDFAKADEALEKVLNLDPENARAYIGKLMILQKYRTTDEMSATLPSEGISFLRDHPLFVKATRFADEEYKKVLAGYDEQNKEAWYGKATRLLNQPDYPGAQRIFSSITGYKDAAEMANKCDILEKDRIYAEAEQLITYGKYVHAQEIFNSINGYRDAAERAEKCGILEKDRIYAEAEELCDSGDYVKAQKTFNSINGHRDAAKQAEKCDILEKDRIYANAKKSMDCGHYVKAREVFNSICGYKDAAEQAERCSKLYDEYRQKIYAEAINLAKHKNYGEAIANFRKISGYKNADQLLQKAQIEEIDRPNVIRKRKKAITVSIVLLIVIVGAVIGITCIQNAIHAAEYAAETAPGTSVNPIKLYSADDLMSISSNNSSDEKYKYYILESDIDLSKTTWNPIDFVGYIDCEGHTIRNVKDAIFGFIENENSIVKNLNVDGSVISGDTSSAYSLIGVIAKGNSGTIENCHVSNAIISGYHVGGISGGGGTIINCSFNGKIDAVGSAGGIAACVRGGDIISDCKSEGSINGGGCVGGIVGIDDTHQWKSSAKITEITNSLSSMKLHSSMGLANGIGFYQNEKIYSGTASGSGVALTAVKNLKERKSYTSPIEPTNGNRFTGTIV